LAATSLVLAGCGDGASTEGGFFIEEIDALVEEFCISNDECYGPDEYVYELCRFYYTVYMYSYSLLEDSAACDEAIVEHLTCISEAPCGQLPESCTEEAQRLLEHCPAGTADWELP
jgi:hypothetical protein